DFEMSFFLQDGSLYCEGLRVKDLQKQVRHSPFYLYSAGQIRENYAAYAAAFQGLSATISYAVKANNNLTILKMLRGLGCGATLVSGNELRLALAAGFEPQHMILNGNGKTLDDLRLAASCGAMVNVDSAFDLAHIQQVSKTLGRSIDVLLRMKPKKY
ncbi:MAG: diaminopimelate decarboxylase, partial [Psychromonas sp.]|nr:diaminopimelate decarboxylase [Psychromonas sp.]